MATFTITLRTDGDVRWLLSLLKLLLRRYRLRCVSVEEDNEARRPKSK
jgi:hypothetical protein